MLCTFFPSTPETASLDGGDRDFNDSSELISSIISGTESAIGADELPQSGVVDGSGSGGVDGGVDAGSGDGRRSGSGSGGNEGSVRRNFSSVSLGSLEDSTEVDINGNNNNNNNGGDELITILN